MSIENYTDDELIEAIDAANDCFADSISQYRSEVAQFGDAWAGAGPELDRMRAGIAELDVEYNRRFPPAPPAPLCSTDEVDYEDGDIPF